MGRDDETEGRNEWPLAALKEAKETVSDVRGAVLDHIETETEYRTSAPSDAGSASKTDERGQDRRTDDAWEADDVDWGDPF
jgi:hypothetical protein